MITAALQAFAQRLAKQIQQGTDLEIMFAESEAIPSALLQGQKYKQIPQAVAPTFVHELLRLCLDGEIDYLLPLRRKEMQALAASKQLFAEYGITLLGPDKSILEELSFLDNPDKTLPIQVLLQGKDLLSPVFYESLIDLSGAYVVSDSGEDVLLVGLL